MAISIHRSREGMPILMSGLPNLREGLIAPEEVRKEMRSYTDVSVDIALVIC